MSGMIDKFPPEFDSAFYRATYPDLREHSDEDLRLHYENYGRGEGRCASPAVSRNNFLSFLAHYENALEIGPFNRPLLSGPNVKYFDVLATEELKSRAISLGDNPEKVPAITLLASQEVCWSCRPVSISWPARIVLSISRISSNTCVR